MNSCTAHSGGGRGVGPRQKARLFGTEGIWQRKPRFNKQGLYAWLWSGHLFILYTYDVNVESVTLAWYIKMLNKHSKFSCRDRSLHQTQLLENRWFQGNWRQSCLSCVLLDVFYAVLYLFSMLFVIVTTVSGECFFHGTPTIALPLRISSSIILHRRHHPSLADGDKYSLRRVSKMTAKSANYSPSEVLLDLAHQKPCKQENKDKKKRPGSAVVTD